MANVNQNIEDALARHQVFILRFSKGQANRLNATIDASVPELAGTLTIGLDNIRRGQQVTASQSKKLTSLQKKVAKIRLPAITEGQAEYTRETAGLVEHELEYSDSLFREEIPVKINYNVPDADKLATRLIAFGSQDGRKIDEWFTELKTGDIGRIMGPVKQGITQGLTTQQIVRGIIGTKDQDFKNGVLQTSRNSATSMVRTITNGVANDARTAFAIDNADILLGEIFVATLDGRTTEICMINDGKLFKVGQGLIPPLHRGCRSTRTPVVDDQQLINSVGERPFVRDTRTRRLREIDFRADAKREQGVDRWKSLTTKQRNREIAKVRSKWAEKNIGQVQSTQTYEQWLRKQPEKFQDKTLGVGKAKLFRQGKISFSRFVDKSGETLTLAQLRKLEG